MMFSPTLKTRQTLAEFDLNSQDSGYGTSFTEKENAFVHFTIKSIFDNQRSPKKKCSNSLFGSFNSVESVVDDGFMELPWKTEMATMPEENELPCNFNSLLEGSIKTLASLSHNNQKPTFRRSVSMKEECLMSSSRARHCLFDSGSILESIENRPFKRPEPPVDNVSPINIKRYKCTESSISPRKERPKVQRSISATEESIMSAVQRCKFSS